ncbi:MAG: hypothetical protein ACKVIK_13690, partial [Rhodospirillales bacterium]
MSEDHKNLILAAVLTVAILFGWQSYVDSQPKPEPQQQAQTSDQKVPGNALVVGQAGPSVATGDAVVPIPNES